MAEESRCQIHATCIALGDVGVLLRGAAGAGKSDLALRLIDGGARLVADDRVDLSREDGTLVARPPPPLAGLLEVRGLGIVRLAADRIAGATAVGLVCDLVNAEAVERLPEPARETLVGVNLPLCRLAPFAASAPLKLRLAAGLGPGSIITDA